MVVTKELLELRVEAPFACFTRPEMKVERVSYPVMTPSAARGVLEAIYWHPQINWRVEEVWVLKPIRYYSILRNEVNKRASRDTSLLVEEARVQRHTVALRDVAYVIRARIEIKDGVVEPFPKYVAQFTRRVANGQCFATPYLGCREFSASFGPANSDEARIEVSEDLGPMLHDINYNPPNNGRYSGRGRPIFFAAKLERGVLRVPLLSKEVLNAAAESEAV